MVVLFRCTERTWAKTKGSHGEQQNFISLHLNFNQQPFYMCAPTQCCGRSGVSPAENKKFMTAITKRSDERLDGLLQYTGSFRGLLHLESKHNSLSKRKLSQRRGKERFHMALLSSKTKFSSWVNLGRSEEPGLKAKLKRAQVHPQLCQYMLRIHPSCDGNSAKCLGCLPVILSDRGRDTE